jgi:hypothetical protein
MSQSNEKPGILRSLSPVWRRRLIAVAIAGFMLAAIAVIGGWLLAPYAVSQIEAYTGTVVTVESAKFSILGTVRLKGLKLFTPEQKPSLILEARKVSAAFSILSLLKGSPQLKGLTINGGVLSAEYDPNLQTWNLASLVQKGQAQSGSVGTLPRMEIKDCAVTLSKRERGRSVRMLTVPLVFDAKTMSGGGYEFRMTSEMPTSKSRPPIGAWSMDVQGKVSDIAGSGDFTVEAVVHNLIFSNKKADGEMRVGREIGEILHPELVRLWDRYKPDGTVDVKARISGSLADITKGQVTATFIFKDVALSYKYFPYLLEHVKGNIFFQNGDLNIEGLAGQHGQTEVSIVGWSRGSGKDWESDVRIHSDKAVIDDDVYRALTKAQKRIWFMFSPSGTSRLDFQYQSQHGKDKLARATLSLIDGQMMYEHFPHRFTNGTGTLIIEPNEARLIDLVSREDGSETTFNGDIRNILSGTPDIDVKVRGTGLAIGSRLLAQSAREQYRRQLSDFDFSGRMDFDLSVFSSHVPGWRIDYIADANIDSPELRYVSKGVALKDVSAHARLTPSRLVLSSVNGLYAGAHVKVSGHMDLVDDANVPMCYQWAVDANNAEIDKGILSLMPQKHAGLLEEMQPSGRVNIAARLGTCGAAAQDSVTVECLGAGVYLKKIGYALTAMTGKVGVRGKAIEFTGLRARVVDPEGGEPGAASINGKMLFGKEKLEELDIQVDANNLRFGKGLRQVVERVSANLYDAIAPTGSIGLAGCNLKVSIDPNGQRFGDFKGRVLFENCAFGKEELSKINATLDVTGFFEREMQQSTVKADLQASTMTIRDKLLTNVRSRVEHRKGEDKWSLGNFIADCYDGKMSGDVLIGSEDGRYSYSLKTSFENVDMGKFLAKPGTDPNARTRGTMKGTLAVTGDLGQKPTRNGELTLKIADMRVGRMSLLAKALTLLSLSIPGDVAFHSMEMNSRIRGDELTIDELVMSGEALDFKGTGSINLDTRMVDIDLAATSPTPTPGLLTSVMVGLRHAVVYLKVRGNLDDPTVNVTPLPLVDKAIQKILGTK